MDLSHLRSFLLAAELQSFTQAAKRQNYSQSAISQQIRDLENAVGAKLFERLPRSVDLTPAGEVLRAHATAIMGAVEAATAALQDVTNGPQGLCRIGAAPTAAGHLLAPDLARIAAAWPGVRLRLETANDGALLDAFTDGDLDVVVLAEPPSPLKTRGREVVPCFEEQLLPVAAPAFARRHGRSLGPDALPDLPIVAWVQGRAPWSRILDELAALGVPPQLVRIAFEAGDVETLKHLIAADAGFGFVPAAACERELAEGQLVLLELPGFRGQLEHTLVHGGSQLAGMIAHALVRPAARQLVG